ncbi:MAG: aspartate aminotransferase family protein [Candidatus Bathyarchaeia archaeon]
MVKSGVCVKKSEELYRKAIELIPGGVNSGLRGPLYGIIPGIHPMYIESAKGSKIYDVDGNEFIDYILGYGPIILGHAHPKVNAAVQEQLKKGTVYGLSTENEIKLAEKIVKMVPCADMVRFTTTGTEANMGAVRIARAYTGKDKIARFDIAYHGWSDSFLISAAGGLPINYYKIASPGIPKSAFEDTIILPWNNIELVEKILQRHSNEIAVVITEIFGEGWVAPKKGFLDSLRKLTEELDILLLFDEVKTGFRLAPGGAQEYFGIVPDLATFGKALGNGFPIAAITGKKKIMENIADKLTISATFNACPLSVTAALATLTELEAGGISLYQRFREIGRRLKKGITDAIQDLRIEAIVEGSEVMFRIAFTQLENITTFSEYKTLDEHQNKRKNFIFSREYVKRGILGHPNHAWCLSMAHTEDDIEKTILAIYSSLKEVKKVKFWGFL